MVTFLVSFSFPRSATFALSSSGPRSAPSATTRSRSRRRTIPYFLFPQRSLSVLVFVLSRRCCSGWQDAVFGKFNISYASARILSFWRDQVPSFSFFLLRSSDSREVQPRFTNPFICSKNSPRHFSPPPLPPGTPSAFLVSVFSCQRSHRLLF